MSTSEPKPRLAWKCWRTPMRHLREPTIHAAHSADEARLQAGRQAGPLNVLKKPLSFVVEAAPEYDEWAATHGQAWGVTEGILKAMGYGEKTK